MKKIKLFFICIVVFLFCTSLNTYAANTDLNLIVPTVMYHKISDNPVEWSDYCISTEQLRSDFEEMKKAGFTPITVNEYLDMADAYKKAVNQKDSVAKAQLEGMIAKSPNPILITFDDGYEDGYTILYPLLREYGFKANLSMVGSYAGNGDFLTVEQIKEMSDSGLVQFGNHTYNLHDVSRAELSNSYMLRANYEQLKDDFLKNMNFLFECTDKNDAFFTYPYGVCSDMTEEILDEMGVRASFVTDLSSKFVKLSDKTRKISRLNRTYQMTSAELVKMINDRKTKQVYSSSYSSLGDYYTNSSVLQSMKKGTSTANIGTAVSTSVGSATKKVQINVYIDGKTYVITGNIENNTTSVAADDLKKIGNIRIKGQAVNRTVNLGNCLVTTDAASNVKVLSANGGRVPVRAFFEFAGYTVNYDTASGTVYIR